MRLYKALVIEDDPEKRDIIFKVLTQLGFDVDAPSNFGEIVHLSLTHHDYRLIASRGQVESFQDRSSYDGINLFTIFDECRNPELQILLLEASVKAMAQLERLGYPLLIGTRVNVESAEQLAEAIKPYFGKQRRNFDAE